MDTSTWIELGLVAAALLGFGLRMEFRATALLKLGEQMLDCQSRTRDELEKATRRNLARDALLQNIWEELRRGNGGVKK